MGVTATEVRCGLWFDVKAIGGNTMLTRRTDLLTFAEVRICAFDIETSKEPLQFPNADLGDQVRCLCVAFRVRVGSVASRSRGTVARRTWRKSDVAARASVHLYLGLVHS